MSERSASWRPGQTVCRCCLAEGCYKDISTEYFWMGKREVYADMLLDTFDVNISFSQAGGPGSSSRLICEPCISRLRDASEFKRQVLECEKAFVQQLEPGSSAIDVDDGAITLTGSEIKVEAIKLEKSLSDDEDFHDAPNFDDDDDDLDDQPLTTFASRVPKKESVDILELLDTEKTPEKRKMPVRAKATPAKKLKAAPKTVVAKAATSKTATKTGKVDTKKKGTEGKSIESKTVKVIWKKRGSEKGNASLIVENSNALPFKYNRGQFFCTICNHSELNISSLRQHFTLTHNKLDLYDKTIRCCLPLKIDITDLECTICGTKQDNLELLKDHLVTHGKNLNGDFEDGVIAFKLHDNDYRCIECGCVCENYIKLLYHMNKHATRHICQICGRKYSNSLKLRTHFTRSHKARVTNTYKCQKCKDVFDTAAEKAAHSASVHGMKRNRCPKCGDYFDSYHRRLRHMQKAHDLKTDYKCALCPAVFITANLRYGHMRSVHKVNPASVFP